MVLRLVWALSIPLLLTELLVAQDPYQVAPDHYHLLFTNPWVRASLVAYGPHEQAQVHNHPATPTTVYIYATDGGPMRFHHVTGENVAGYTIERPAVKAGAIRFAHGMPETHWVEYLGSEPTQYVRLELKTEPIDRPTRDVRLPPPNLDSTHSTLLNQFENGQIRILRLTCAAATACPVSEHPNDQAVVVTMSGPERGRVQWSPPNATGPLELVRIELKSEPVAAR